MADEKLGSEPKNNADFIWQDREVRFDVKTRLLDCRKGEAIIDSINSVEDTKGNNGERGSLIVTNLRLLWVSHANSKVNLSVGFNTIVSATIKTARSKLRGHTQALCVLAQFATRFEFIFTSLVRNSPRLFTTVQSVLRSYETSKLYRDLKLRGSTIREGQLVLLPQEQIVSKIQGVWNLSSEQGNLGSFFLTNVRVVWHANLAPNFNVSLPYIQIRSIRVRDSRFGRALVIETFQKAGGYILGFRVDPKDKIISVFKELNALYEVYSENPFFGVESKLESEAQTLEQVKVPTVDEDIEVIDDGEDVQAMAAYYADNMMNDATRFGLIIYDDELGLATEKTSDGVSLQHLWRVA